MLGNPIIHLGNKNFRTFQKSVNYYKIYYKKNTVYWTIVSNLIGKKCILK